MIKTYETKHDIEIVKPNIIINIEATPTRIKLKENKKPNIGSKLNKRCIDVRLEKEKRMKIYKAAKLKGSFSLNTFCDFYRFYTNMSRDLVCKKIAANDVLYTYFKAKGYLTARMSANGTYIKWSVSFDNRTEFARELKTILSSDYQVKTLAKIKELKAKYGKR